MTEKTAQESIGGAKHAAGRGSEGPSSSSSRAAGPAAVVVVIVLLLMPLLYVLSIGPVVWLSSRDIIDVQEDSYVALFYAPLIHLVDSSTAIEYGLTWYVELWEAPRPPTAYEVTPYVPPAVAPAPTPTKPATPPPAASPAK